ncbi:hypothetical protein BH10PSE12_BH10PSE12_06360 [soil metagenome]
MFEFIDLSLEMHKRVIEAHEKSIAAAKQSVAGANAAAAIQKTMTDATEANLNAWSRWLSLWGISR